MSIVTTPYYTCDNADEHLAQVLRKMISVDADGNVGWNVFIISGAFYEITDVDIIALITDETKWSEATGFADEASLVDEDPFGYYNDYVHNVSYFWDGVHLTRQVFNNFSL